MSEPGDKPIFRAEMTIDKYNVDGHDYRGEPMGFELFAVTIHLENNPSTVIAVALTLDEAKTLARAAISQTGGEITSEGPVN